MSDNPSSGRLSRFGREVTADQQFWNLWRQGNPPAVADFLAQRVGLSPEQVASILGIEQYERWLKGERIPAEDYLRLLPKGEQRDQAACDIIYGEFLLREQLGEHPQLDEYTARFPNEADLLSRQIELHNALTPKPPPPDQPANSSLQNPSQTVLDAELAVVLLGNVRGGPIVPPSSPQKHPAQEPFIPGYTILQELGRGGMGIVYKARQLSLDRIVALKVLKVDADTDSVQLGRMRREAQATARLSHPHIVTVYDAGLVDNTFYLAMEYVPGIDLHRLVVEQGPLPVKSACEYIRQVALGLQHAHEHGLVHRDIKPSNLIVAFADRSGLSVGSREPLSAQGTIKILDLGLARLLPSSNEMVRDLRSPNQTPMTLAGAFMGTPDFIAPEQANDPRQADIRSDLYSLGCTFFFLLAGRPPFIGPTPLSILMQHHIDAPPTIETYRADLPPGVSAIVMRLLAKQPRERYQTPAELARVLETVVANGDVNPVGEWKSETVQTKTAGKTESVSVRTGVLHRFQGHSNWVKGVDFSPDGNQLASAGLDRTVRLWDIAGGRSSAVLTGHDGGVLCLAYSPDGGMLASGSEDHCLYLWDLAQKQIAWKGRGHTDLVNTLCFSPRGDTLLSGGHDGTLRVWDKSTGNQLRSWSAHVGAIWGVAIVPPGQLALSCGQDRSIRLWDVESGQSIAAFTEQSMVVTCVAVSPDGKWALSGGMDGIVRLWDMSSLRQLCELDGHEGRITSVCFSPDGRKVLSGSRDMSARVWDLIFFNGKPGSAKVREVLSKHTKWVNDVAWSPTGNLVATCSVDRTVCIWQLAQR